MINNKHLLCIFIITNFVNAFTNPIRTIPWITEEAINFLEKFLKQKSNARILEFGCGGSTIWFSKKTLNLISIEHDKNWFNIISNYLKTHKECKTVDLKLISRPYYIICKEFPDDYFDLILIDGRDRVKCTENCIRLIKPGGVLILDNSERPYYKRVFELLANWKIHETAQNSPDSLGFWYPGWKTTYWIKPKQ